MLKYVSSEGASVSADSISWVNLAKLILILLIYRLNSIIF